MRSTPWLLLLLSPCLAQEPELVSLTPAPSDEVLFNPGMGLYLQYPPLDSQPDEWFMKLSDIAYYRLEWNDLNPAKDVYTFDEYFGPRFDFWVKQHGKRLAFRVMCQSMHSRSSFVTPQWVFDSGVPGVKHEGLAGQEQTDPVFWDDRYLDAQCTFIQKLGEYHDGREGLEFVDIGSIGEWGEMHLMRWTPAQLAQTGFSEARYIAAYRRIIDAHRQAFPRTRVFLNVGGRNHLTINDYAALNGMHFRQDGLNPKGASANVEDWLYKDYAPRGVLCNLEFHSGYNEMVKKGWDLQETLDRALASPLSYLNTNLFGGAGYRQAPVEVQAKLADVARRLGYRFVVAKVEHRAQVKVVPGRGSRVGVATTWRNDGLASCPGSFALQWSLLDTAGRELSSALVYPPTPTTRWAPGGAEVALTAMLRVPADTAPGDYRLAVTMLDPASGRTIRLGIGGRDEQGRYLLSTVKLVPGAVTNAILLREGFEGPGLQLRTAQGVTATLEQGHAHTGEGCLLVSGTATNVWNYASARLGAAEAGARYRLSAWVQVEKLDGQARPPYLKLAANDAEGRWITNFDTQPYNVKQLGTWQKLEAFGDLPANAASLDFAIEKGGVEGSVDVVLRLDEVEVELVEGQ